MCFLKVVGDQCCEFTVKQEFPVCSFSFGRDVDLSTYCDYALQFTLHVHGFPLDPHRGLFYMLVSVLRPVPPQPKLPSQEDVVY